MRRPPSATPQAGFSLLETLVAFTILTLIFFAANASFGNGLSGLSRGEDRLVMLTLAQSIQHQAGRTVELRPNAPVSGRQGAYVWEVSARPYALDVDPVTGEARPLPPEAPALLELTVRVSRPGPTSPPAIVLTSIVPEGGRP